MPGARHISHTAEGRANWQVMRPGRVKVGSGGGRTATLSPGCRSRSSSRIDPPRVAARTATPRVIDGRGTLNFLA
ncbi:hypothetical protein BN159_7706 [Streptomyces davaonensis JCM 4913]|uniref:Uncharacterized protein n=1 Tax=Streptomyces davaonensis (strain DSM 101723 / JCM 4913 / KCC S-0913 / 768) TaxID=1214101 RepID=K4REW7_STRDJ|nr:hypothetical protein BN159_7706 [Streptomyces davaonensis JCM 4913]